MPGANMLRETADSIQCGVCNYHHAKGETRPMNTDAQCTRCHGRGYQPEKRKPSKRNPNALGFYARTCPKCGGTGYINAPVVSQEPAQSPIESRVDELLSETECGYCSDDFDDADLCEDCSGRLTS